MDIKVFHAYVKLHQKKVNFEKCKAIEHPLHMCEVNCLGRKEYFTCMQRQKSRNGKENAAMHK